MKRTLAILVLALLFPVLVSALGPSDAYQIGATAELGVVKVWYHTLQFGQNTTVFDWVKNGGQEILFPFKRLTADLTLFRRHDIVFLYQPLTIPTTSRVPDDLTGGILIEDRTFDPGEGLDLKYGFDFWRVSYLYNFLAGPRARVGAGASLQLRNASIVFKSTNGEAVTVNQNLGPVPALKVRAEYRWPVGLFVGLEADGLYASSAYINGADFDFEGSILDASLRAGLAVAKQADVFLNLRFLGGSATGTASKEDPKWTEGESGYSDNRLATTSLTLGLRLR